MADARGHSACCSAMGNPDHTRRISRQVVVAGTGVIVIAAMGTWLGLVRPGYDPSPDFAAVLGALTGCAGAVMSASLFYGAHRRERETARASQQRLAEAEQALEEALRGARHQVIVEAGGNLVIHDQATGGVRGEGQADSSDTADRGLSSTAPSTRLALPELWATTHARLDHYHSIATGQAHRSFRNAQVASGLGFVLLVAFVFVALNASTTAGSIVIGGLGAVSAALAGFVSRTFVRSQEASAAHLRSYFDQPLEMSRFLAAERLIADTELDETQRADVLAALVQSMVGGPHQPPQDLSNPCGQ
ncbi:hypothetical protein [Streptomyces sp. WMMB 714]|uniref:hypothetical protein n=1 Tax=Streptomyces sp. WMMB 714 TaxID=1286822 RepID=UPI0020C76D11|nr:hypothetical protein [Streptomyces sp. WMMB 714]